MVHEFHVYLELNVAVEAEATESELRVLKRTGVVQDSLTEKLRQALAAETINPADSVNGYAEITEVDNEDCAIIDSYDFPAFDV